MLIFSYFIFIFPQLKSSKAAHCFHEKYNSPKNPSSFYSLLGHFDLKNDHELGSIKVDLNKFILHPDWSQHFSAYDADLAILFLSREIIYNLFIQPICLPQSEVNVFNVRGSVAGYGLREGAIRHESKPRHVEISSVDQSTCHRMESDLLRFGSAR